MVTQEIKNGVAGQGGLGQEPHSGAFLDHVGEVLRGVSGNQNHLRWLRRSVELLGNVKATLPAETDVYQRDIGQQFLGATNGLNAGRRHADDRNALTRQQTARSVDENSAVINNQATHTFLQYHAFQLPSATSAKALLLVGT
jgi:hypothetical protein